MITMAERREKRRKTQVIMHESRYIQNYQWSQRDPSETMIRTPKNFLGKNEIKSMDENFL